MYFQCGKFQLDLSRPLVMGILNVTPDSFSDGGLHVQRDAALRHAHQLMQEGADLLDIGGESTRPGAQPVSVQQELDRVMPVIEGLHGAPLPLSVDSSKPEVMREALSAGVSMINDINALQHEAALDGVAASDAAVCLMHKQGSPQTMQKHPDYQNVVQEVLEFLRNRMDAVRSAGIALDRIVVDPGFGFGKTLKHNLELLGQLHRFPSLGVPVLVGLSRKSMLGALTGQDVDGRLPASIAAALLAVQHGARIVRVHDVRATVDALKVWNSVGGFSTYS